METDLPPGFGRFLSSVGLDENDSSHVTAFGRWLKEGPDPNFPLREKIRKKKKVTETDWFQAFTEFLVAKVRELTVSLYLARLSSSGELTIAELSDLFGVHRATIYRWIDERGFPASTSSEGRKKLWSEDAVEAWIRANYEF